ncbi:MAG: ABC transporter permease [Caldilineaceae bacterium]|nr:ABC transporter permease [Caldilineaceae bacterium]MCY4091201.1 ABC transporter permease [Caldilineaceae bacterium]MCY4116333.1 ABC transporter permease [Caldilineaceae bacterium]MDE0070230.1 ABC transporter permease [Caldilineaceae bacterium]MDE0181380.1 ABC transporter permease [Caldilineaceae bacterium]
MTDEAAHAAPVGDGRERADTDGETGVGAVSLPAGEARRRGPSPFAGREAISPGAMAWRRFRRHKLAVIGACVLAVIVIVAMFAPVLAPHDPNSIDLNLSYVSPSGAHLLGTDISGRDLLSRLIFASRISVSVGLVSVSIYVAIAIAIGGISGYYGGLVDSILMRFTDTMLSFPTLMMIFIVVSILGPSIFNVMLVIGVFGWPGLARVIRGQFLQIRGMDYVLSARSVGVQSSRIILRHILPNAIGPVIVWATFGMAGAIMFEASLSFLGLGVQPPQASWGNMLVDAQRLKIIRDLPWVWVPPGLAVVMMVLSINFMGDGLRDALDPRTLL